MWSDSRDAVASGGLEQNEAESSTAEQRDGGYA